MTFEEYNAKMKEKVKQLSECTWEEFDDLADELGAFQEEYMTEVRDSTDDNTIYGIFDYLIKQSQSGNVIQYVYLESEAERIDQKLWEEYGDYLLYTDIYPTTDDRFALDIMFGGYYTPYWDEWKWKGEFLYDTTRDYT